MIQHPPEPMHPPRQSGGGRRDWHDTEEPRSPYGRDRDYEPEPSRFPYAGDASDPRDRPYHARPDDNPPAQFPDWQQSDERPRGPGYRGRDWHREQTREMDDYYAERYANPETGRRPPPPYRNGAGHPQRREAPLRQRPEPAARHGGAGSWNTGQANGRAPVNYRGRAPKGYVRSDERIREDICDHLSDDPAVDASDISVSVRDGIVTLEGGTRDRPQKHRAEDIADGCGGVKDVRNYLNVRNRGNGGGRDDRSEPPRG